MANEVQAAQEGPLHTRPAAADLSAKAGFACVLNSSGQVALAGANVIPDGIIMRGNTSGNPVTYHVLDGSWLMISIGGTVAQGDQVVTASDAQFVLGTSTEFCVAVMNEPGADGETCSAQCQYKGAIA